MSDFPHQFADHYEFLLREVLSSIDDTVVVFNQDHRVIYANDAAEDVFGSELPGKDILLLVPEDKRSRFEHVVTTLKNSEHRYTELQGDKEFVGKHASHHTFYASGKLAKLQGEMSFILVLQDTTWKKALEDELESALMHLRATGKGLEERLEHPAIVDDFPPD